MCQISFKSGKGFWRRRTLKTFVMVVMATKVLDEIPQNLGICIKLIMVIMVKFGDNPKHSFWGKDLSRNHYIVLYKILGVVLDVTRVSPGVQIWKWCWGILRWYYVPSIKAVGLTDCMVLNKSSLMILPFLLPWQPEIFYMEFKK